MPDNSDSDTLHYKNFIPDDTDYVPIDRIISVSDEFFTPFDAMREQFGYSWEQVFRRFLMYRPGIQYIFSAPDKFEGGVMLDTSTVMNLIPMWIENIRQNWDYLKSSINNMPNAVGRTAITISAGPSAVKHNHFQLLAESGFQEKGGLIISTSHSLLNCLKAGIIPDMVSNVDGSVRIRDYLDNPLIIKHIPEIPMVLTASSSHDVVKFWADHGGKMYFFRNSIPENVLPNVDKFLSSMLPDLPTIDTGGNSGSFTVNLAIVLGCKTVCTIGLDLSNQMNVPVRSTAYWHRFVENLGHLDIDTLAELKERAYTQYHHTVFDTDCYFDDVFKVYRESLLGAAEYYANVGINLINASEEGCVEGPGIKCMQFADFLSGCGL